MMPRALGRTPPGRGTKWVVMLGLGLSLAGPAAGCSRNPATGKIQAGLPSEKEEIQLGRQADKDIVSTIGVYEHGELGKYVAAVGLKISTKSERLRLPWTFRVLDEPAVNAFALPGGYVYVTRGILAHLNSESELAGVLGHEIGHVAARHGVVQMRKARVARATVGIFRVVDPNLQHIGGVAARSATLTLLKYSRQDEYEADDLAIRYVLRAKYDGNAINEMFTVLGAISEQSEGERVPPWLQTHPEPKDRSDRVARKLIDKGVRPKAVAPDPDYLRRIDGMLYGEDPRLGFFVGTAFIHPTRAFQLDLPRGWGAAHDGEGVVAISGDKKALFVLGRSTAASPEDALFEFLHSDSIQAGQGWQKDIGGIPVQSSTFLLNTSDGRWMGLVAFYGFGGRLMTMVGLAPASVWPDHAEQVTETFLSFRRVRDRRLLDVQPMTIKIARGDGAGTLAQFHRRNPSVVTLKELALINHMDPDDRLQRGQRVKRVVGFNPEMLETGK